MKFTIIFLLLFISSLNAQSNSSENENKVNNHNQGLIELVKNLNERVNALEENAQHFETGTIKIEAIKTKALNHTSSCPSEGTPRGAIKQRHNFDKAFKDVPIVTISLNQIDIVNSDASRLNVVINNTDERGFVYSFYTWCYTNVANATANWIAVPNRKGNNESIQ